MQCQKLRRVFERKVQQKGEEEKFGQKLNVHWKVNQGKILVSYKVQKVSS